ncbi:MAG: DNA recombination protein RmuC [Candidatus Sungbacteria bacterium]|nr:DNA recombination protein RmuC [Candidatus Sungbacteria bacterium]
MTIEFIILMLLVVAGFGGVFWFLSRKKEEPVKDDGTQNSLLMLQNQINQVTRTLDERLGESSRLLQSQYGASNRIIQDVTERLTKLDETNRQVVGFADQLKNLEDILKNPKQRGILGEYYLETLLKNVFPPGMYQMQYKMGKDDAGRDLIVDAVVFVKDKIIPIDSKFSLENYNRVREEHDQAERERLEKVFKQDLKNRIDETSKYVRPQDNTMDFAFMFIPAEGIYYDLLVNQVGSIKTNTRDLIEYAFIEKKVHIVSPTTFLSHLKMVMQGLRALQIEDSAKEIKKRVEELGKHLGTYETYMQKMGNHLGTTVNAYNSAYKELGKIDKDVLRITGEKAGIEPALVEGPAAES